MSLTGSPRIFLKRETVCSCEWRNVYIYHDFPFTVPQESILGPVSFLIYTAPLADVMVWLSSVRRQHPSIRIF